MPDHGRPLTPEQIFKRVTWRGVLPITGVTEQSTTWTIAGVAAIVALFIGHLDAVSKIVTARGIRWSLILLSTSVLFGAISKLLGMAVQSGLNSVTELEKLLLSEGGNHLMD